jgi:hypothetical protein
MTHAAAFRDNARRNVRQTRKWSSILIVAVDSTCADATSLKLLAVGNLVGEPVEAVGGINIEFLKVRHLPNLRRNTDQMASV